MNLNPKPYLGVCIVRVPLTKPLSLYSTGVFVAEVPEASSFIGDVGTHFRGTILVQLVCIHLYITKHICIYIYTYIHRTVCRARDTHTHGRAKFCKKDADLSDARTCIPLQRLEVSMIEMPRAYICRCVYIYTHIPK